MRCSGTRRTPAQSPTWLDTYPAVSESSDLKHADHSHAHEEGEREMFRPSYKLLLTPIEGDVPSVTLRLSIELDIKVHPNFEHVCDGIDRYDSNTIKNPATGELNKVNLVEIAEKLRAALAVAKSAPNLPSDSALILEDDQFLNPISLTDIQIIDSLLSRVCSVQVEGKQLPKELVFASGTSEWRLKFGSASEAQVLIKQFETRMIEIKDPKSPHFIPIPKEQDFHGIMLDEGKSELQKEVDAINRYVNTLNSGGDPIGARDQYLKDTKGGREPNFREGESGGFRGNGGFYR